MPIKTRNLLFAVVCFAGALPIGAQPVTAARPFREFEVASIKPSRPGAIGSLIQLRSPQGGTTTARNVPIRVLILVAYHIQDFQLADGPGWLNTERYDLDAKYPAAASLDDIRAMLQKLLADRCNLAVRREMKDGPVYDLLVAKGGPKLKPPKADGFPGIQSGANGQLFAENATMASLAEVLPEKVSRPVIDKTGLTGSWGFRLEGTSEEEGAPDPAKPSIFTALQEQLGLRLESARSPIQNIAIQRIEKPSAN